LVNYGEERKFVALRFTVGTFTVTC
jgi:hypothetical protein